MIALRKAILKEAREEGALKEEDTIELWLPHEDIERGASSADSLTNRLKDLKFDDLATATDDEQTVASIMRGVQTRQSNHVHLLVQVMPRFDNPLARLPKPPANTTAFITEKFRELLIATKQASSPSANAKSAKYLEHQGSAFPILDGRYNPSAESPTTQAPPIELFHPVFAEFRAKVADITTPTPDKLICRSASLVRLVSAITPSECTRMLPSRTLLGAILGKPFVQTWNIDGSSAGHVALGRALRLGEPERVALALVEEKGELGTGGSEPSVQGSFSYAKFWAADDHRQVRETCCCPTFIIAVAGPWLAILGAVTTSQFIVQRLTDYLWLGYSRVNDDAHVLRIARILYALGSSLESLDAYYESLVSGPNQDGRLHPRFFPSITSYPSNNTEVKFTYKEPLERHDTCVTFLATLDASNGRPVVVKFVQRYGAAVHELLANQGMAPKLLYYGPIAGRGVSYGELKMVVMEYIQGKTFTGYFDTKPIPQDVVAAVKEGIRIIHACGFVYGDLRKPNLMIADAIDGSMHTSLGDRVRFIDFDWAGRAGDVRYPLHLSDSICTPAGTSEYELIQKIHDTKMLAVL